jgi:putative membrane protein
MTEPAEPRPTTATLPPPADSDAAPPAPSAPPAPPAPSAPAVPPAPAVAGRRRMQTRISGARVGLIAAVVGLAVVMIFIIQNAHTVRISFLGAHLRLSLAVALLFAAIVGALIMAAAGTARITQLRRIMRRDRRRAEAGGAAAERAGHGG